MDKSKKLQKGIFAAYLFPLTRRLLAIPYLQALRESFCIMMPFIMILALINMVGNLVLNPLGPVMDENGLGLGTFLSGGLRDQTYRDSEFFHVMLTCTAYLNITNFLYYMIFSLIFTDRLAKLWEVDRILACLCTISGYVFMLAVFNEGMENISMYFQGRGFLLSLIISTATVQAFKKFSKVSLMRTPLAMGLSLQLSYSMRHLISLTFTFLVSISVVLGWVLFEEVIGTMPGIFAALFSQSIAQHPFSAMVYEFFRRIFWWLGLNGSSLTFAWTEAFYVPAQISNELEGTKFIFTSEFFDAVSVSLLGLAISIWVFSSKDRLRSISAYSMPSLVLSINEPFLFALPIVLNPLFLIPYVLAPMVNVLIGYLAISSGIVPVFKHSIGSLAPVLLDGVIATGDIMGAVLQLVWLSVDIVIYTPFVIIFNLMEHEEDINGEDTETRDLTPKEVREI